MIIFSDICGEAHDELFTDAYPFTVVDDVVYEVEAEMKQVKDQNDFNIGANASAEEEGENLDENVRTVNNVVEGMQLVETSFDKKAYMTYIKGYMKSVSNKLKESNPERVEPFQKAAAAYVKTVIGQISEYQFFTGASMDPDGMVVLCIWRDEKPVMIYFKDGVKSQKV